ncbi:amidohydrolase family protein [Ethanoligenens harbinense]|uniref:Amidohydrolase 2 n=1 Tax=Ethanoligenens harbinense (strain DSM 18485 / JCM 12961 / CGMCC 1.5033 / YUAN-3) TaxID=663278 RepID=E6U2T4_ETHHY|nr:amidohydrolase family protein [Ethanoligenens harbinense]ADU27476.1 amidohydrolase 2 [Ethanoligenens harbinense YUAN-3]AVQ96533.1 amidohydrolase [Ethanoligenens harbinense YUAN-3]AYF39195.1 amidohydrolase [Ethanoligenens harbinense]AYF42018.1 amidohydrolase [Ethanoligenens harbinense]QCN92773.1 amidohydrolase [Ethanoligenens harbinense]
MQFFDFHTHIYPEHIAARSVEGMRAHYHLAASGTGLVENLLACAEKAGGGYLMALAVASKPGQVATINKWLSRHLSDRLFGFGGLHPHSKHLEQDAEQLLALGLRGIKLHPDYQHVAADDPSMDAVYDLAVQHHLPVLIHAGDVRTPYSSPVRIAHVLERFPQMTVIVPHLGGYSEWDEAERHIIGKNCYIDTSSSLWALPPEKAAELIRKHGVERVLFGTDYPLTTQAEELERFDRLGFTEEERRLILLENAKRFLGLS